GVIRVNDRVPAEGAAGDKVDDSVTSAPYKVYNIGNNQPVQLMHMIHVLESCLGKKAEMRMLPMQPGDVPATFADVDALIRDAGFRPETSIETGAENFVRWFRDYHKV
ncbi:MAG: capsular biosynthesis protein CpsI, partial [Phycisphaerae bacterium]